MRLETAKEVTSVLIDLLGSSCSRVEVAGSVRRESPEVWDIELVAIPAYTPFDQLNFALDRAQNILAPGPPSKGMKKPPSGDRYKRLVHLPTETQVDLFIVRPPADWGVIFTLRTGPASFSHFLVTLALMQGKKVEDGQLWELTPQRRRIDCPEEADFFRALGYKLIPPNERYLAIDFGGLAKWKL